MIYRFACFICMLLIILCTGCSPHEMNIDDLIDELDRSGITIDKIGDLFDPPSGVNDEPIFSVGTRTVMISKGDVTGAMLQVREYPDESAAITETAYISRNGHDLSKTGSNVKVHVDWISLPHWFQSGRLIVLYIGPEGLADDSEIPDVLQEILGQQFAGDGPVRSIQ